MLSFFIVLCLIYGFYAGARRGLVLQFFMTVGYLISVIIARIVYQSLGKNLELFIPYPSATETSHFTFFNDRLGLNLDQSFYAAVAFVLVVIFGWLIVRFAAVFFNRLTFFPVVHEANYLGGGILGLLTVYIMIFLLLYLAAMIPMPGIQSALENSFVAKIMIKYSLILSPLFYNWWITKII